MVEYVYGLPELRHEYLKSKRIHMTLNLPYKVRAFLYVLTTIGTPIIAYLLAKGIIGDLELTLWSAVVTAVSALAAFNVTVPEGK